MTTAEAPDTTSVAEIKVSYINGVYAPMAPANGPAANTGAVRNPGSALDVSPVANMALLPPSHFEPPTSSLSMPETPSLMRLQITAPVAPKTPADDKTKKAIEGRTIALMSRGWEDFPLVPFTYKTTGTRYSDLEPVSFDLRVDPSPANVLIAVLRTTIERRAKHSHNHSRFAPTAVGNGYIFTSAQDARKRISGTSIDKQP